MVWCMLMNATIGVNVLKKFDLTDGSSAKNCKLIVVQKLYSNLKKLYGMLHTPKMIIGRMSYNADVVFLLQDLL
jgi:hypothetical protein